MRRFSSRSGFADVANITLERSESPSGETKAFGGEGGFLPYLLRAMVEHFFLKNVIDVHLPK
jgi:hypothetical protein